MEVVISREAIAQAAKQAAYQGADFSNCPYPNETEAAALWRREFHTHQYQLSGEASA